MKVKTVLKVLIVLGVILLLVASAPAAYAGQGCFVPIGATNGQATYTPCPIGQSCYLSTNTDTGVSIGICGDASKPGLIVQYQP